MLCGKTPYEKRGPLVVNEYHTRPKKFTSSHWTPFKTKKAHFYIINQHCTRSKKLTFSHWTSYETKEAHFLPLNIAQTKEVTMALNPVAKSIDTLLVRYIYYVCHKQAHQVHKHYSTDDKYTVVNGFVDTVRLISKEEGLTTVPPTLVLLWHQRETLQVCCWFGRVCINIIIYNLQPIKGIPKPIYLILIILW